MAIRSSWRARRLLAVLALGAAALVRPFAMPAAGDPGDGLCDRTWTGLASQSWHDADNWLPSGVPTADDDVCIELPGTYTVTIGPDAPATAATLALGLPLGTENPTLAVDGQPLTLGLGGEVRGAATLLLTSTAPGGAAASVVTNGPLVNLGTVRSSAGTGGARTLEGALTNAGTLDVTAPLAYGGTSDLTNTGAVTVVPGASLCVCGAPGSTPGLVNSTGSLVTNGGLRVAAARMTQGSGPSSGLIDVRGSTLTLAGGAAAAFLVQAGTTTVVGDIAASQNITALAGAATGNVTLALPGDATNAGSVLLRSTDAARRASLVMGTGATLANTGSLRSVAGPGAGHRIVGPVVNTGTVAVNADAVLGGTLTNRGALTVGTSATFTVGAAARVVNDTAGAVTGTGRLVVANGGDWEQGAGTVGGNVVLASGGDLTFTGSGAGQFVAEGAGTISGDIAAGQSLILSAGATRGASAELTNAGLLGLVASGTTTTSLSLPQGARLLNTGTLRSITLPGPAPASRIDGAVTNDGTVSVAAGASLGTTSFTQGTTGVLEVEVPGPTSFGRVTTGETALAGTLRALVTYTPTAQTAFPVLTHGASTGTFGTIEVGTSGFGVRYDPGAVTLLSPDRPPTADAGPDRSVTSGAVFTLDGGASRDPEGLALTYLWETESAAVIREPTSAVTQVDGVTGPATLPFRLTVTDAGGNIATDDVVITVNPK